MMVGFQQQKLFLVRTTERHTGAKFFSSGLWHSQTRPQNVSVWLGHRNPLRCDPLPADVWESSTVQRTHVVRDDATSRILGTRLPGGRRRTRPSLHIRQSGTYLLSPAHIKLYKWRSRVYYFSCRKLSMSKFKFSFVLKLVVFKKP